MPVVGAGSEAVSERRVPAVERDVSAHEPGTRGVVPPIGRVDAALPSVASRPPRPTRVQLGSAGIDLPVRPVGVAPDGQMALPPNPEVVGWYRFGPVPGAGTGSVVLAGHLDSTRFGVGPLVGLRRVESGDTLTVTRADGTRGDYAVVEVARYDQQALPEELFDREGPERLRIITCGGEYLPEEGGYQLNLVVTAVPR
jgi:hypothetical protein